MKKSRNAIALFLIFTLLFTAVPLQSSAESKTITKDEIIYNANYYPVTVGSDASKAGFAYRLFDEQGNYTIEVEDNAFFPYEIQFTYQGENFVKWFDTPDSKVEIGGHIFGIHSRVTDDTTIQQIGVVVDGKYVAAKPAAKGFDEPTIQTCSLIPLAVDERLTLDLSEFNKFQLQDVKFETVLNKINPAITSGGAVKVAWMSYHYKHEHAKSYQIANSLDSFNIAKLGGNKVEFIVGSTKQLDPNNKRYVIEFVYDKTPLIDDVVLYRRDDTELSDYTEFQELNQINNSYRLSFGVLDEKEYYVDKTFMEDEFSYQFKINPRYTSMGAISVYRGIYKDKTEVAEALQSDSTIKLDSSFIYDGTIEPHNYIIRDGNYYSQAFTFVYRDNETNKEFFDYFNLIVNYQNYVNWWNSNLRDSSGNWFNCNSSYDYQSRELTFEPNSPEYTYEDEYLLKMDYCYAGIWNKPEYITEHIKKAVVGHFDTLEAAQGQPDIKSEVFASGYRTKFTEEGLKITVFLDDAVEQYLFKLKIAEEEPEEEPEEPEEEPEDSSVGVLIYKKPKLPRPLSSDVYFEVKDIKTTSQSAIDCYVLPYQHDSYYTFGYQTLFTLDDVDLSKVIPRFYSYNKTNIYASDPNNATAAGTLQESGETVVDFSRGAVQYAAAAENGVQLKNYWVTVLKKHLGGAKLFVNGINGTDGRRREVYLNRRFDFLHDVFIANVGDQALMGLNVELINPQNVKLDAYWTVGGANNDTLAAFTTVESPRYSDLAELPNVAKIRLVADGEGEVAGTLKITADGQEPVVIELSGQAGDPRILTTEIPDAVKYVPYAAQILHTNKYYWNEVSFSLEDGQLPKGMVLKPNGEIYGTPKETGTFDFEVRMENSDNQFWSSRQNYTLIVKPNTNVNVNAETDDGYDVKMHLGTLIVASNPNSDYIVSSDKDQDFVSEGEYGEFIDFWLNGERLERDVDYKSESGSTVITVLSQTFKNKVNKNGLNTIAAEYRIDGDESKELRRAAQNFIVRRRRPIIVPQPIGPKPQPIEPKPQPEKPQPTEPEKPQPTEPEKPQPTEPEKPEPTEPEKPEPTEPEKPKPSVPSIEDDEDEDDGEDEDKTAVQYEVVEKVGTIIETVELANASRLKVSEVDQLALQKAIKKARQRDDKTADKEDVLIELILKAKDINEDEVVIQIPKKSLGELAELDRANLKIVAQDLATVEVPHNSVVDLEQKIDGDLQVGIKRKNNQLDLNFSSNDKKVENFKQEVFVQIPKLAKGEVIVLVQQGKQEVIVKKSYVSADGNVYAMIKGSGKIKVVNTSKEFADVKENDWFKNAVAFVNSRRLFIGVDADHFEPHQAMTRAMFATVLYRLEDSPETSKQALFNDVKSDAWYSAGVNWMKQNNLIMGNGNGQFAPDAIITREQLVTLMYRYAKHLDRDSITRGDINKFKDVSKLSPWSVEAMRWAVGEGLIQGSKQMLMPRASTSRAEVAAIVERYVKYLVKKD